MRDMDQKEADNVKLRHTISKYEGYFKVIHGCYQAETAKAIAEKDTVVQDLTEGIRQLQMQDNTVDEQIAQLKLTIHTQNGLIEDRDTTIEKLKAENDRIRARVQRRDISILHLRQNLERTRKPTAETTTPAPGSNDKSPAKTLLIPAAEEHVRQHADYKHENAPRDNKTYEHVRIDKDIGFRHDQGKMRPEDYGSNSHWDLGLCFEHFTKSHGCRLPGRICPLRHHSLTKDEQAYINLLSSSGRLALRRFRDLVGRTEPTASTSGR